MMPDQRLHYRICLYVSVNQSQGIFGGIQCNFGTRRMIEHLVLIFCLTKLLQLSAQFE
jgi:hypothetical protein